MYGATEGELKVIASDPKDVHMYNVKKFEFLKNIVDDLIVNVCYGTNSLGRHTAHYLHTVVHVRTYNLFVLQGDSLHTQCI